MICMRYNLNLFSRLIGFSECDWQIIWLWEWFLVVAFGFHEWLHFNWTICMNTDVFMHCTPDYSCDMSSDLIIKANKIITKVTTQSPISVTCLLTLKIVVMCGLCQLCIITGNCSSHICLHIFIWFNRVVLGVSPEALVLSASVCCPDSVQRGRGLVWMHLL